MPTQSNVITTPRTDTTPQAPLELQHHVAQLAALLRRVDAEQYTIEPVGGFPCSIGQQVRHLLDHVAAVVRGFSTAAIDYDARERGTTIETDAITAVDEIDRLTEALTEPVDYNCEVTLRAMLDSHEDAREFRSTLGREIAFVLSHTVHHQAMIAAMASTLGVEVPRYFGYAPATIAHLEQQACAR